MNPHRWLLVLLTLSVPTIASASDSDIDGYQLPLVDSFAINRFESGSSVATENGLFQLVRMTSSGRSRSTETLVPKVESVAVQDLVIVGKAAGGYFILDTRSKAAQPEVLTSREGWEAELQRLGVGDAIQLKNPDDLALAVPDTVLRPWHYRILGPRLGVSDDILSLAVQLLGFAIAFVVGLAQSPGKAAMPFAIVLGVIVNVVAMILIADGGPGAFVGFFVFPLICALAAGLGKGLRSLASRLRSKGAPSGKVFTAK